MNANNTEVTCISLCSGYEGIGLGIKRVLPNLRTILYSEIEKYACEVLVQRMEEGKIDTAPIWTNLKTLPCEQFSGKVDILTGGYPCQGFSAAGKRLGDKDPRYLWGYFREIIRIIQPKMCFFENVEGHISLGLREVLTDLVNLGYRVENDCGEATWGIFSASECLDSTGKRAPHQRKRVFILAVSRSPEPNRVPESEEWDSDGTVGDSGFDMANPSQQGPQGRCELGKQETRRETKEQIRYDIAGHDSQQWPARPGQPQHDWEEPRVLANAKSERDAYGKECTRGSESDIKNTDYWTQTQPCMGRKPDESAGRLDPNRNRIDRLRLLGNGVVPATAERAFRTLYGRIINPDKNYQQPGIQLELF